MPIDQLVYFGREERNPLMEHRFNLHPGKIYRAITRHLVYDGVLEGLQIHINDQGFIPTRIHLVTGFCYHPCDIHKAPFEDIVIPGEAVGTGDFGRVLDEKGFWKRRKILEGRK